MKNILITGASGDIGSKIAKSLAGSGRRLFLQGFQGVKELDTLCDEITCRGRYAVYVITEGESY